MCGTDHAAASRALVPAAVAQVATPRTLSGMPVVIADHIISFNPSAIRALREAHRTLGHIGAGFLISTTRAIASRCSALPLHPHLQGSRALVPAAEELPATSGTLSEMPVEITDHIISFNPRVIPILRAASRTLQHFGARFLAANPGESVSRHSALPSVLYHHLQSSLIHFQMFPGFESDRSCLRFHLSIPNCLQRFGVRGEYPNRIFTLRDIVQFNQRIENANLRRIWSGIRHPIVVANPALAGVPEIDASAQEVRIWMRAEGNQIQLQGIHTQHLGHGQLTCLPPEMRLCTGLQILHLEQNQLTFIPDQFFMSLVTLRHLNLSHNQLRFIPEHLFDGLVSLNTLNLDSNQLTSLPGGIFRGLNALVALHLYNNQLVSLPEGIFNGLGMLQNLFLQRNQLISLPRGLFDGLNGLQFLSLYDNPLLISFYNVGHTVQQGRDFILCNNIEFLQTMHTFYSYACESPLAQLYQLVAGISIEAGHPIFEAVPEAVQGAFSRLPETLRNAIFRCIWEEADRPNNGDCQWDGTHAFDDMQIFCKALKRYVRQYTYLPFNEEQRNALYGHVYDLARSEPGAGNVNFDSPQWGEQNAWRHILRLIDALMRLQR